jgi:hypothetical protein
MIIIPKNIANPPHNGAVTHHQDQVIRPVNLSTKKIRNRAPAKLIPPLFELEFDILFRFKVNFRQI